MERMKNLTQTGDMSVHMVGGGLSLIRDQKEHLQESGFPEAMDDAFPGVQNVSWAT